MSPASVPATTIPAAPSTRRPPSSETRRTGWASRCTRRPDVSSSVGRPDLARREQRDDGRDEEERDAEVLPHERALHTELVERVADRVGNRAGRHLGDDAERERGRRRTRRTTRRARGARAGAPSRTASRARTVGAATTSREANTPAPTSRRDGEQGRCDDECTTRCTAASTSGRRSLSVNGRMRSVQPNGVSHSSHFVLGPESAIIRTTNATPNTAMPSPVASRRVRPSCDVERADADEHRGREHDARARTARSRRPRSRHPGSAPASNVISVVPTKITPTAAPSAASVAVVARAGAGRAREHEVPAAGVLLAAQQSGRGEETPERADGREEDEALVDRVPADGVDRGDRSEQHRDAGVAARGRGELLPARVGPGSCSRRRARTRAIVPPNTSAQTVALIHTCLNARRAMARSTRAPAIASVPPASRAVDEDTGASLHAFAAPAAASP